jgi:tetratricopeptide (TPR) repeat protein
MRTIFIILFTFSLFVSIAQPIPVYTPDKKEEVRPKPILPKPKPPTPKPSTPQNKPTVKVKYDFQAAYSDILKAKNNNDFYLVLNLIENLPTQYQTDKDVLLVSANANFDLKNYITCKDICNTIWNKNFNSYTLSEAYNLYAYSCCIQYKKNIDYITRGSLRQDALAAVNHALDLNSYKGKFWETRGEIYFLLGDEYQKCIDDMTKAINLSPSANSYFRRGLAYSNLDGYFKEAYDDLNKAKFLGETDAALEETLSKNAYTLYLLGVDENRKKNYDKAWDYFRAAETAGDYAYSAMWKGSMYEFNQGKFIQGLSVESRYKAAISEYEQSVSHGFDDTGFCCHRLGIIYLNKSNSGVIQRDKAKAKEYFQKGCKIGNTDCCKALKELQ